MNRGVNPDTLINVVDLTKYIPDEPIDRKTMLRFVREKLGNKLIEETADKKAIISLPKNSRQIRHVAGAKLYKALNYPPNKKWKNRHQASLLNVSQLIKSSVLIESEPNHKSKEKHAAARYHHFYLPIKVKDKLYTVHIVGEQLKDSIGYTPIDVKLYDVIVAKKRYILYSHPKRLKSKECTFYNYNIRNASECQRLPQSAVY